MPIGRGGLDRVDQAVVLFYTLALGFRGAVVDFHSVGAAQRSDSITGYLLSLVHLWVPLPSFVLGGTGS